MSVVEPGNRHAPVPVRRWQWSLLAAILVAAVAVRLPTLVKEGFWIDELYMLEYSAGRCHADFELPRDRILRPPPRLTSLYDAPPAWRIWTSLDHDQHPPLYYLLLRLWRDLVGSTDAAIRSLSVVASVVAIALLFDVGRLLFSPGAALWACAIMSVAQVQILYAQEARSYALLCMFVLAAADALVRIERLGPSRPRLAALAASALAVVLTHYFGAAACAAFALYAAVSFPRPARRRTLLVLTCAAAVFCAAWLPFALRQLHGFAYAYDADWLADPNPVGSNASRMLVRLAKAPIRFFADPAVRRPGPLPMFASIILLLPLLRLRRLPALLLPALWAFAWIALPATVDLLRSTHQLDFNRYLLGAAPAVYLLAAALLWDGPARVRHLLPASLFLYCLVSLPWTFDNSKPEWRHLAQDIGRLATDDDLIIYHSPGVGDWYAAVMVLDVEHYAPDLRAPAIIMTKPLSPDDLARARTARTLWLAKSPGDVDLPHLVPGFHVTRSYFEWGVGTLTRLIPDPAPPAETRTNSTPTTPDK